MDKRIDILDGWRALSILLVLAGHWFPLGPSAWGMNGAFASAGMALFFILSGFLITSLLLHDARVPNFLIRRFFRILPLAYVAIVILAIVGGGSIADLSANLLFVANLPPTSLLKGGGHLWSLCVEMQFYIAIAGLVFLAGKRGLYILPLICVAITAIRVAQGAHISIFTWQRVDEILAGTCLALFVALPKAASWMRRVPTITPLLLFPLLVASAHESAGALNYARPYIAMLTIGTSIYAAPVLMRRLFTSRPALYVAEISYALYVVHGMLTHTWLGSGDKLEKYAKRPLLVAITFALAHLSTRTLEARMIGLGKRLSARIGSPRPVAAGK